MLNLFEMRMQDYKMEGHAEGLAEGLATGRAEGLKEGIRQTIQLLKASGMPEEEIATRLKLNVCEVAAVQP